MRETRAAACRVAEGADLWMISPSFQHIQPQTTKVLVRTDANAGSISDESALEGRRQQQLQQKEQQRRRVTRGAPVEADPPFLAASHRRKRTRWVRGCILAGGRLAAARLLTSLWGLQPPGSGGEPKQGSLGVPFPRRSEQVDESSHVERLPSQVAKWQVGRAVPGAPAPAGPTACLRLIRVLSRYAERRLPPAARWTSPLWCPPLS